MRLGRVINVFSRMSALIWTGNQGEKPESDSLRRLVAYSFRIPAGEVNRYGPADGLSVENLEGLLMVDKRHLLLASQSASWQILHD